LAITGNTTLEGQRDVQGNLTGTIALNMTAPTLTPGGSVTLKDISVTALPNLQFNGVPLIMDKSNFRGSDLTLVNTLSQPQWTARDSKVQNDKVILTSSCAPNKSSLLSQFG